MVTKKLITFAWRELTVCLRVTDSSQSDWRKLWCWDWVEPCAAQRGGVCVWGGDSLNYTEVYTSVVISSLREQPQVPPSSSEGKQNWNSIIALFVFSYILGVNVKSKLDRVVKKRQYDRHAQELITPVQPKRRALWARQVLQQSANRCAPRLNNQRYYTHQIFSR